jgi:hypothetical protein
MKSSYQSGKSARKKLVKLALGRHAILMAVLLAVFLGMARTASAQVVYSGDKGGFAVSAGAAASGFQVQYGQQKLLGFSGVVDIDTRRRFGLEGEGRWLMFHNPNQIQSKTYMGGVRYHYAFGKYQVYGKGLVGVGQFTFPYKYAQGNYLVIAPGAGVDYRWTRRISFRVNVEYQFWPQFTFGSMGAIGGDVGIQYHIFR